MSRRHDWTVRRREHSRSLDELAAAVVVDAALVVAWRPAVDHHRRLRCTKSVVEVAIWRGRIAADIWHFGG